MFQCFKVNLFYNLYEFYNDPVFKLFIIICIYLNYLYICY